MILLCRAWRGRPWRHPRRLTFPALVLLFSLGGAPVAAQPDGPARPGERQEDRGDRDRPRLSSREVVRLFDRYVVMQARQLLDLDPETGEAFSQRLEALQEVRRRSVQDRIALLRELEDLVEDAPPSGPDVGVIEQRLTALADLKDRSAAEEAAAYTAVDALLDVPQRAQFRVFEAQMERRKLELLSHARRGRRSEFRRDEPR